MTFRGLAPHALLCTGLLLVTSTTFAQQEQEQDIPSADRAPEMQLLRDYDADEMPPPPPPFKFLSDETRNWIRNKAKESFDAIKDTTIGSYFMRELKRREEVCGRQYTFDIDSVTDFMSSPAVWMPGRVKVLAAPQEAFFAKKMAIEQARCELWVNTYIFNDASTTKVLMYETAKAIERGVNVRFTLDSSGSTTGHFQFSGPFHADLKSIHFAKPGINPCTGKPATVDTVIFNPQLRLKNILDAATAELIGVKTEERTSIDLNRRSHDKILLADPQDPAISVAIVGGRNWTDSYYGIPKPDDHTYEDMEILVKDDANKPSRYRMIDTIGKHTVQLMCHKGNRWLLPTWATPNRLPDYRKEYDRLLALPEMKAVVARMASPTDRNAYINEGLIPAEVRWGDEIENIRRDNSDAFQDPNRLATKTTNPDSIVDVSRELLATAKKSIRIVSPYLYLSKPERSVLKGWAMNDKNRKMLIVSNSAMTSDNVPAQTLVDRIVAPDFHREGKLDDGRWFTPDAERVAFYELGRIDSDRLQINSNRPDKKSYGKLHAKYWTIDGEVSFIGSHNFDPRSRYYNSEIGFFVRSKKVAAEVESVFNSAQARSTVWNSPEYREILAQPTFKRTLLFQDFLETVFENFEELASLI